MEKSQLFISLTDDQCIGNIIGKKEFSEKFEKSGRVLIFENELSKEQHFLF